ncbi:hypothetical protein ASPVEDRAFT_46376 [Aspergillus versicolor CBS 583.65]|uniref:Uncharacterized protein n=1 Tax=Aspergillus versicolor CBS 583.65 TaxID=1036611 RepID=A0A1L9PZN9_ASPVE|nr:uncharacterized protein ASPVEDRAFT_46376 [Aspergillus versicolor CBS 583.65]OJJ06991.1 hypothetical protein ASPVEDRAFT_46376 [Aspergillus versicolor CBS 583.65]
MNPTRLRVRLPQHTSLQIHPPTPRLSQRPALRQSLPPTSQRPQSHAYSTRTDSLPKIIQPSFWASLLPKSFRIRSSQSSSASESKSREWNPASFYIIIFILIGSQAIRMIALKNEYTGYVRSTDAKIRLLREVIGKVQRGEEVDVKKLLGTGEERVEREWDEVLREIEREDSLWHQKQKKDEEDAAEKAKADRRAQLQEQAGKDPAVPAVDATDESTAKDNQAKRKVSFF